LVEGRRSSNSTEEVATLVFQSWLPRDQEGDFVLSQTPTIMRYLGKKLVFYPKDEEGESQADSIMSTITDFIGEV
jgi:hypothetical protein